MEEQQTAPAPRSSNLGVPIAIVISAALIAGAIIYTSPSGGPTNPTQVAGAPTPQQQETVEINVEPVTEDDHIRGNPNAPIVLVEYSDYDCPFCKTFHETLNQIMVDYGATGEVAWVYRHFPLEQLHPNADSIAAASECVAELGGNDAFWKFTDMVFDERDVRESTDISRLSEFAAAAGVDASQYALCANSGKYDEQIQDDIQEAIAAGGRGTPHTIVLVGDQQAPINGAQPYEVVKQIIAGLLTQIEGGQIEVTENN